MPLNRGTQVSVRAREAHDFGPKGSGQIIFIGAHFQPYWLAAKEDLSSCAPGFWLTRPRRLAEKLFLQPAHIPFGESRRFGSRAAARNRHPRRAVMRQAQHITPGSAVWHQPRSEEHTSELQSL